MSQSSIIEQLLAQKKDLKKQLEKIENTLLSELGKEFIEDYSTILKQNSLSLPSYFSLSFTEEYNDEGGTDTYLERVYFYDAAKKAMNIDIEVEYRGYTEEFSYAFREMVSDHFNVDELEKIVDEEDIFSIK